MSEREGLLRKLLTGGLLLFAGSMLQAALTFLMRAYVAQSLGKASYGVFTAGISMLVVVSTLLLLGVERGIGRYLPRTDGDAAARGVVLSGLVLVVPTTVVVVLVTVTNAELLARVAFGDSSLAPVAVAFALGVPCAVIVRLAIGVVQGRQRSLPKLVIQNVTLPVTAFAGVVLAVQLEYGLLGVGVAYLLAYALAAVVGLYYVGRLLPFGGDVAWMRRELLVFSLPLVAVTAIRIFFLDLDVVMLSFLTTQGDVGTYGGVFPIVKMFGIFLASFSFLVMPIFSELDVDSDYERIQDLYAVVAKWTFLCTLPLALSLVFFPREVIAVTFGPDYRSGAPALQVLAVAYFLHASVGPNSNALISLGYTRTLMADNLLAAAANVILNVALIPEYTFFGAAVATATSYVLRNVLVSVHLYRYAGIHPVSRGLATAGTGAVVLGVASSTVVGAWLDGVVGLVAFLVAFLLAIPVVVVYGGGIGGGEAALVRQAGERFGVDTSWVLARVEDE